MISYFRTMKWLLVFVVPLFFSCGAAVVVDYDPTTSFSEYATYALYPTLSSGLSELDDKRILRIADSLLQEKGFRKSETPQLFINFYAKERVGASRSTIGIGIGSGGRNGGVGISGGIPIGGNTIDQKFTLDIIDVQQDNLIWQGVLEQAYPEQATAEQMDAHYLKVLSAILKKFPPNAQ